MAPLSRRDVMTPSVIGAIVTLGILVVCGAFCAIIFCVMCKQQRRRAKALKKMQEEHRPFMGHLSSAPADPQSDETVAQYSYELRDQQQYHGPVELQGSGRIGPPPPQQLDGYVAAPTFDDTTPAVELPASALHSNADAKYTRYK